MTRFIHFDRYRDDLLAGLDGSHVIDMLRSKLRSVKANLLRGDFRRFWGYASPTAAATFLDSCSAEAMRSRLDPLKKGSSDGCQSPIPPTDSAEEAGNRRRHDGPSRESGRCS